MKRTHHRRDAPQTLSPMKPMLPVTITSAWLSGTMAFSSATTRREFRAMAVPANRRVPFHCWRLKKHTTRALRLSYRRWRGCADRARPHGSALASRGGTDRPRASEASEPSDEFLPDTATWNVVGDYVVIAIATLHGRRVKESILQPLPL